jgi:hypothetical protein
VTAEAEAHTQLDLVVAERHFDPDLGIVTVFEPERHRGSRIDWSEASGMVVREWSAVAPWNPVPKQTTVTKYNKAWSIPSSNNLQTVTLNVDHRQVAGEHHFCLDQGFQFEDGEPDHLPPPQRLRLLSGLRLSRPRAPTARSTPRVTWDLLSSSLRAIQRTTTGLPRTSTSGSTTLLSSRTTLGQPTTARMRGPRHVR